MCSNVSPSPEGELYLWSHLGLRNRYHDPSADLWGTLFTMNSDCPVGVWRRAASSHCRDVKLWRLALVARSELAHYGSCVITSFEVLTIWYYCFKTVMMAMTTLSLLPKKLKLSLQCFLIKRLRGSSHGSSCVRNSACTPSFGMFIHLWQSHVCKTGPDVAEDRGSRSIGLQWIDITVKGGYSFPPCRAVSSHISYWTYLVDTILVLLFY